jgi:hypothetical protein
MGQDTVGGITTSYGIDGMGIESQWRFSAPVQTDPEATQLPVKRVPLLLRARRVKQLRRGLAYKREGRYV